jgi:hypothetical protein
VCVEAKGTTTEAELGGDRLGWVVDFTWSSG